MQLATSFGRHQAASFMIGPTGLNDALWPKGEISKIGSVSCCGAMAT
jgi:hypothetical protein